MIKNQGSALCAGRAVIRSCWGWFGLTADSFTSCVLSSLPGIFPPAPTPLTWFCCLYLQPTGSLKNIWKVTALTLDVVKAVFPVFLSNNFIKLPQTGVWWDFIFLHCSLIFGCILMQRECKNESGIDINGRRILPVDYFWRWKRRNPTKTVIQNKAGKKSIFLLSSLLESKWLSSSWCYWGLRKPTDCLFLILNECERIKPDTFGWMHLWCVADIGEILYCLATEGLPIHFELLSRLFHGDAIAHESLIDTVAKVRRVIALMVSPEANQNSSKRFCWIWYQGSGSTPGILLSAIKLIDITKNNVCVSVGFFFNRLFSSKNGK